MDHTLSSALDSVEISISKFTTVEELSSIDGAYDLDEKSRQTADAEYDAISNESIRKRDTLLDTYVVISDAILGGMGSVWKVLHKNWNSVLAMKRPQPRFFQEGSALRKTLFVKECENWINLGMHPNIVSCYYVREIGGVPTVFSEWMDNGTLRERIRDGSLYEGTDEEVGKKIQDIAMQLARGLKYSHDNGLLHQDVKPGNLLVTNGWDVKVADFGLAASARESDKEAGQYSNSVAENSAAPIRSAGYTLEYCPREQMEGAEPRAWMDLYAWTLIVLEMYAGKRFWKTGPEALELLSGSEGSIRALFSTFRVPVPDRMRKLLCACIKFKGREINENDPGDWLLYGKKMAEHGSAMQEFLRQYNFLPVEQQILDFEAVVFELDHIYRESFKEGYPRPNVDAARDTAANLNNRALSFLDLHQPAKAERLWEAALAKEPNHPDSRFNRTLFHIRGRKPDGGRVIQNIASRSDYVLTDEQFLYQELGRNQRLVKRNMARFTPFDDEDISHAAFSGNELLISGLTEEYRYECDYHIYRVNKKDGGLLEDDPMDEIQDLCQWVYGIFLTPDDPDKSPFVTYIDCYSIDGSHYLSDSYELDPDRQKHLKNLSLRMNQSHTNMIAESAGRDPETHEDIRMLKIIRAYGRDDGLQWIKKLSEKMDILFLPGGEIICGHTEDEVWIRSIRNNYATPDFSIAVRASRVLFRPDGRELYVLLQENGREVWKVFRLEFEYG